MFHVGLRPENYAKGIDYSKLEGVKPKVAPTIPDDKELPQAPDGFVFYRVQSGDTLVSLSVRFGISQNKLRRYNNKVCFGHRLSHITGKLLLIPLDPSALLTSDMRSQLTRIYSDDAKDRQQTQGADDDVKSAEPDEAGKYQLRKALSFHARGLDDNRADYYLGEANWNVRKALEIWREDDAWEKRRKVMDACSMSAEEATALLETHSGDVANAIRVWMKEQKKFEKQRRGKETKGAEEGDEMCEGNSNVTPGQVTYVELNTLVTETPRGDDDAEKKKMASCFGR